MKQEHLSGVIDRVTFHNPENGFAVLRVTVPKRRGLVTVVGQTPRAVAGEFLEADGVWREDPEHGRQFQASALKTAPPTTIEGIEKYLGSGLVKGIGPVYAKKIVAVFGEKTLEVIDESPTFLKEVKGIGAGRIQRIRESWRQQKAVREILVFLQSYGLGTARAVRIYKTYGDRAIDLIRQDPYRLARDISGIGFATADEMAQKLGIAADSPIRARALVRHVLQQASSEGHCALPRDQLLERASKTTEISGDVMRAALDELVASEDLISEVDSDDGDWIYSRTMFFSESGVAAQMHRLMQTPASLADIDFSKAYSWLADRLGIALAVQQQEAVRLAVTKKVCVITGGPGTGKTTLVRGILEILTAKGKKTALCAPTGRAAQRLSETTGREAKTIHRLLEYDAGGPKRDADRPLDVDFVIVDEVSMVDILLMFHLVRAVPDKASLVLVGDVNQLPSVGPGKVLTDCIASKSLPTVRLTEIFRQAKESGIVQAAYQIHDGEEPTSAPPDKLGEFYFIDVETPPIIADRVLSLILDRVPKRFGLDPLDDIQVLVPMHRGELGIAEFNRRMQEAANPPGEGPEVQRFGTKFRVGDKVMQTMNNYDREVFNGDGGRIHRIDEGEKELTVTFDGRHVVYDFEDLDELALAYAISIHKSQGSEYPAVIIPLHTQHFMLLQRNLLYTAVTRGKKLVIIVGSRRALALAVSRQDTSYRFTRLAKRISKLL